MADLPNFTRGTRGGDESRSSTTEILTPKPRAVINPDHTLDHFNLTRATANADTIAPSLRGATSKIISFDVDGDDAADYHGNSFRITDSENRFVIFEFDQTSTTVTGEKDPSNDDKVTVGIDSLDPAEEVNVEVGGRLYTTIVSCLRDYSYLANLSHDAYATRLGYTISLSHTNLVGSSGGFPFTNYGSFDVSYSGGTEVSTIAVTDGTNGIDVQLPFSLGSKILRGSW